MCTSDKTKLVGILEEFDKETVIAAVNEMGLGGFDLPGGVLINPGVFLLNGGGKKKADSCSPANVEISNVTVRKTFTGDQPADSDYTTVTDDTEDALKKIEMGRCSGKCANDKKCGYKAGKRSYSYSTEEKGGKKFLVCSGSSTGTCVCP